MIIGLIMFKTISNNDNMSGFPDTWTTPLFMNLGSAIYQKKPESSIHAKAHHESVSKQVQQLRTAQSDPLPGYTWWLQVRQVDFKTAW